MSAQKHPFFLVRWHFTRVCKLNIYRHIATNTYICLCLSSHPDPRSTLSPVSDPVVAAGWGNIRSQHRPALSSSAVLRNPCPAWADWASLCLRRCTLSRWQMGPAGLQDTHNYPRKKSTTRLGPMRFQCQPQSTNRVFELIGTGLGSGCFRTKLRVWDQGLTIAILYWI